MPACSLRRFMRDSIFCIYVSLMVKGIILCSGRAAVRPVHREASPTRAYDCLPRYCFLVASRGTSDLRFVHVFLHLNLSQKTVGFEFVWVGRSHHISSCLSALQVAIGRPTRKCLPCSCVSVLNTCVFSALGELQRTTYSS